MSRRSAMITEEEWRAHWPADEADPEDTDAELSSEDEKSGEAKKVPAPNGAKAVVKTFAVTQVSFASNYSYTVCPPNVCPQLTSTAAPEIRLAGGSRRRGSPMSHGTMVILAVTGIGESCVAETLVARGRRDWGDRDAHGLQLHLAAQPFHPRRRAAAGRGSGAAGGHPRRRTARRPVARLGGKACSGTGNSGHRAGGLRLRRPGRRGREPEVPYRVDDAGRYRPGGESPRHLPGRDDSAERRRDSAHPRCPPGRHRRQPAHRGQRGGRHGW